MAEKAEKPAEESLAEAIRKRFAPLGGVDLKIPPRDVADREPPRFDGPEYDKLSGKRLEAAMAMLTIRKLDDEVKRRLRIRAAEHGRSMEEEARTILAEALKAAKRRRACHSASGRRELCPRHSPDR